MKVTEFDVSRKGWIHGEGSAPSALFRKKDGKMCCLGFFCLAAGCSPEDIAGYQVPNELEEECKEMIADQLLTPQPVRDPSLMHREMVNMLMAANDRMTDVRGTDMDIKDEVDRERIITNLFAQMGVKVNFVD